MLRLPPQVSRQSMRKMLARSSNSNATGVVQHKNQLLLQVQSAAVCCLRAPQGTQRLAHNHMLPHCLHQQINTPVVLSDAEWLAAEQARLKGRFVASVRVIIICNVFLKPLLGFLRGNSLETRCVQPRVPTTRHSSHPS